MGDGRLRVTISDADQVENVENAAEAVADEHDVEISTGRGRAAAGEISMAEAVNLMAVAYTGHDAADKGEEGDDAEL